MQLYTQKKVMIYILCYNDDTYNNAISYYSKYNWARPIIIEHQDYTFENAFWKQMKKIESEWINCDMVGTLSHKAHIKININNVNNIIENNMQELLYYHFARLQINVLNHNSFAIRYHPNFDKMYIYLLNHFKFKDTNECLHNYFMCKPFLMKSFIDWYLNNCLPLIITHPLSFTNSKYSGNINEDELIKICGKPYYPLIVFVIERFIPCYFDNILKFV